MDLDQFTVWSEGDTDLMCERCPGESNVVASSYGVLGSVKQLPTPITMSALLKAATQHNFEVHRG